MKAILDHTEPIADNIITFWFKPNRAVHYTAGQFTEIKLVHSSPDERGDKRWFTLSSSPSEKLLSITTKFSQPSSSFKRTLKSLTPGTEVNLADPMGDFVLLKDSRLPLIFVAGGMGITPMRSMIKWLHDTKEQRDITLLYVASTKGQLAFLPLLKAYCQKTLIMSRETDGDKAELTAQKILDLTNPPRDARIYLSGPEPMIEILVDQFASTAISSDQLLTDYFPGYKPI